MRTFMDCWSTVLQAKCPSCHSSSSVIAQYWRTACLLIRNALNRAHICDNSHLVMLGVVDSIETSLIDLHAKFDRCVICMCGVHTKTLPWHHAPWRSSCDCLCIYLFVWQRHNSLKKLHCCGEYQQFYGNITVFLGQKWCNCVQWIWYYDNIYSMSWATVIKLTLVHGMLLLVMLCRLTVSHAVNQL